MKRKTLLLLSLIVLLLLTSCKEKERAMYEFTYAEQADAKFYGMTDEELLYSIQDKYFCMTSVVSKQKEGIEAYWSYRSYEGVYEKMLYIKLYHYNKETGSDLKLDYIKDFLSEEFESDGSRRFFANGLHPEIKEYINWHRFDDAFNNINGENNFKDKFLQFVETAINGNPEFSSELIYRRPEYTYDMDEFVYLEQFTIKAIDEFIKAYENPGSEVNLFETELIETNAILYK